VGTTTLLAPDAYTRRDIQLTLAFAALGTVFDGVELNLLSFPLVYISQTLNVAIVSIVAAITVQGFASLAGGFGLGWLGDILGRRRGLALCVFIYGLGTTLAAFAPNYPTFLATRVLAGIGIGGEFGLAFAMFSECWQTERRGLMGGVIQSMFIVGQIVTQGVLYVTLSMFGHDFGWRAGFLVLGVVSIILAWATVMWTPESHKWLRYQEELRSGKLPEALKRARVPFVDLFRGGLGGGTVAFMVIVTGAFMYSYSLGTFGPTFLLKIAQVPLGTTTLILFIGFLITIASYVGFSALSDVIGRKRAFMLANLVGVIGLAGYLVLVVNGWTYVGPQFWTSPMFWVMSIAQGGYGGFGIFGVWMSEFFPTRVRSTGSNTAYYTGRGFGAGLYPLVALGLAGGNVAYALGLGVIGAIVAMIIATLTPDRTGREIQAIE